MGLIVVSIKIATPLSHKGARGAKPKTDVSKSIWNDFIAASGLEIFTGWVLEDKAFQEVTVVAGMAAVTMLI